MDMVTWSVGQSISQSASQPFNNPSELCVFDLSIKANCSFYSSRNVEADDYTKAASTSKP